MNHSIIQGGTIPPAALMDSSFSWLGVTMPQTVPLARPMFLRMLSAALGVPGLPGRGAAVAPSEANSINVTRTVNLWNDII